MCLYPKAIRNPHYLPNKSNNYNPPALRDKRFAYIQADCGKCYECRQKKARQWCIRINEEFKYNKCYFITLTLSPNTVEELTGETMLKNLKGQENDLAKYCLRHMLERVRKETGKSLRHWCVTELGEENDRIHIHGIFIGEGSDKLVRKHWKYGFVFVGNYTTLRTARYITKYMTKTDVRHDWFEGKVLCSAGIGKGYVGRYTRMRTREVINKLVYSKHADNPILTHYMYQDGKFTGMPYYYKTKIFTIEEREHLWGVQQEKPYVWICGQKVDKKDINLQDNLTRMAREEMIKLKIDHPEIWEEQKKALRREKKRKWERKQGIYQDRIEKERLNGLKMREILNEIHCISEENDIYLYRDKQPNVQFKLFDYENY